MCETMVTNLIKHGYKEFPPSDIVHPNVTQCFQKRFDDAVGKKYFINVYEWVIKHYKQDIGYEFEIVMSKADSDLPLKMLFYSGWEVKDVEDFVEKLFQTGLFDYYERWDEC